jgi:hypothetical protein
MAMVPVLHLSCRSEVAFPKLVDISPCHLLIPCQVLQALRVQLCYESCP